LTSDNRRPSFASWLVVEVNALDHGELHGIHAVVMDRTAITSIEKRSGPDVDRFVTNGKAMKLLPRVLRNEHMQNLEMQNPALIHNNILQFLMMVRTFFAWISTENRCSALQASASEGGREHCPPWI